MTNHWVDIKNADVILIMGSNAAENHPIAFKWIEEARKPNRFDVPGYPPAKVISVDPRFTRSSSKADIYAPMRSGSDIAFLGGMIKYAIDNNKINLQYLLDCTNAAYFINPGFETCRDPNHPGLFSGWPGGNIYGRSYDTTTWDYHKDDAGNPIRLANALEGDCPVHGASCGAKTVFYHLREQYSIYSSAMVKKICGTPEDLFLQICDTFTDTYVDDRSATMLYAMGWTQHTNGSQLIRTATILQLLLGNIGVAGGGINALRGWHNVQGATDMAYLQHLLTGYNPAPLNTVKYSILGAVGTPNSYLDTTKSVALDPDPTTPPVSGNWWGNRPKYVKSMLMAWWPIDPSRPSGSQRMDPAISYQFIPKKHKDCTYMSIIEDMRADKIRGLFVWGSNPAVMGPSTLKEREALGHLDWLVVCDLFHTETSDFWHGPDVIPSEIKTEVFLLPGAAYFEKKGSVTNSSRLAQWKDQACNPPGDAKDELEIVKLLGDAIKSAYSSDTAQITGTHYGPDNSNQLVDADGRNFEDLGVKVGMIVKNETDGCCGLVSEIITTYSTNDTLVFSGGLTGGNENDFDTGDAFMIPTKDAPILLLNWLYDPILNNLGGSTTDLAEGVAKEIHGYTLDADGKPVTLVTNFVGLKDTGETACGNWLYSGTWPGTPDLITGNYNQMANRRPEDYGTGNVIRSPAESIGIYAKWGYSWPLNRRILYNRASVYQTGPNEGKPLAPQKWVIEWTGSVYKNAGDVVDGYATSRPSAYYPFIMKNDGMGHLMGIKALADGPFPEHYEPRETPLTANPLTGATFPLWDPCVYQYQADSDYAPPGSTQYPIICTTYRLTEHWHGGGITRTLPYLCELMPEPFVEMSEELADELGIPKNSDGSYQAVYVNIYSARNPKNSSKPPVQVKACVTKRFKPFTINGKTVHQVGLPWHWGWAGIATGPSANILTPFIGDVNTRIPETKVFLVNIELA